MHAVNPSWEWSLQEYRHYGEVGIEDLTFVGHAKKDFKHHGSWQDDGAYKPLEYKRLVNSWIRRVNFESVSEAASIIFGANVSVYDVEITGNRGHAAIRMQQSSRGFIGKVFDNSGGYTTADTQFTAYHESGLGLYYGCGVSKQSFGNVMWKIHYGSDECFESHAKQPRATLIDDCEGGFMQYHMGGDKADLPHHLDDLTIWNFNCTSKGTGYYDSPYYWWWSPSGNPAVKVMPPSIIGFHGLNVDFKEGQYKILRSQGTAVDPESLYAAQLKARLGKVPDWLVALSQASADIRPIVTNRANIEGIYNLEGKRMTGTLQDQPQGIYIVKGKKVIKK